MMNRKYVQVGQGRLGVLIAEAVKLSGSASSITFARINEDLGLCDLQGEELNGAVEQLVICISPSPNSQWQWSNILQGIAKQVNEKRLVINQLIFISSTRVYDGINCGVITASTTAIAQSQAGLNLLKAEVHLKKMAKSTCILRCSGLFSEKSAIYHKYYQMLFINSEKVRFAVSVEQVVQKVLDLLLQEDPQLFINHYCLLTDGCCYVNGEKIELTDPKLSLFAKRLLKLSDCVSIK